MNIRQNKTTLKSLATIIDLTKQLQGLNKEIQAKRAELDRIQALLVEKDHQREQATAEAALMLNQALTEGDENRRIGLDRIFLEEDNQVFQEFRGGLGEVIRRLKFVYHLDILDPLPAEFRDLVHR